MPPPKHPKPVRRRESCLSHAPAEHTISLVWEGERYTLDLTTPEYVELLRIIDTFMQVSDRVVAKRISEPVRYGKNSAARWWADKNGFELPHHNYTPPEIIELWEAAGAPEPERALPPTKRRRTRRPELLEEMVRDYLCGLSLNQIAIKYDIDRFWFSKELDRIGIEKRPGGRRGAIKARAIRAAIEEATRRKAAGLDPIPEFRDVVSEMYLDYTKNNLPIEDIAKKYDINANAVTRILKSAKVKIRGRGASSHRNSKTWVKNPIEITPKVLDEMVDDYVVKKMSTSKMAKKYRKDRNTISRLLKERGVVIDKTSRDVSDQRYPNREKTHCAHGHPYDEWNTRICTDKKTGKTWRQCIICQRKNKQRSDARKRALSGSAAEASIQVEADVEGMSGG